MTHHTSCFVHHNLLHWVWLWILAAIAITALQRSVAGQPIESLPTLPRFPFPDHSLDSLPDHRSSDASLPDVLQLNRRGDYENALKLWQRIHLDEPSKSWKQVGMGVAHLRLGNLDDAQHHLAKASQVDPANAVAEYFLGRLYQVKSRRVPFWYQMNKENPFRFASLDRTDSQVPQAGATDRDSQSELGKTYLPHSRRYDYDRQARQHFRHAVELATCCDLDQPIRTRRPVVQLASHRSGRMGVTVRGLLVSLGEEDFAEKAYREVAGRLASIQTPSPPSTQTTETIRPPTLVDLGGGNRIVLSSVISQARQCLRPILSDERESKRCWG
jgi:hypothetical protein